MGDSYANPLLEGFMDNILGGVKVYESEYLPEGVDALLMGEEPSLDPAKIAAFKNLMNKHIDQQFMNAMHGEDPIPDPEKEAMQNNEMWGAF